MVLIGQDHVHIHIIVDGRIQTTDVEAQEWEHPPGQKHKGKMICTQFYDKMLAEKQEMSGVMFSPTKSKVWPNKDMNSVNVGLNSKVFLKLYPAKLNGDKSGIFLLTLRLRE